MVNKILIIGNVGADPDVRTLENGTKVARLRVATSESFKGQDGQRRELTEWHNIEAWRGLADVVDRYVRKGDKVYIDGSMHYREYTDREGVTRIAATIQAKELKMLTPRNERTTTPTATVEQPMQHQQPKAMPPMPEEGPDDLPF